RKASRRLAKSASRHGRGSEAVVPAKALRKQRPIRRVLSFWCSGQRPSVTTEAGGFVNLADAVLHQRIRPLIGACCAPGHHGYQRAFELINGQASNGPFGSPVFACAGKTDPPSSSHPLADLGGYPATRTAGNAGLAAPRCPAPAGTHGSD